jgi:Mn-dependent DtxR family transcriptional regulator
VSEEAIEKFKKSYGFESTPFQMIHANTSMLLPPCPSPDEVAHMIECLQKDGLINHGRPDLQVCIAGRVSTPHAAVL